MENGHFHLNTFAFSPFCCDSIIESIGNPEKIEALGYLLRHSAELFEKQAVLLTSHLLNRLQQNTGFFPEYSDITFKVIDYWMKKTPKASHILISDTAFFNRLPPQAGTYAVPYALSKKGIRRYGGYGLFHSWAVETAGAFAKLPLSRIISVYIGDYTNIAAVKDGIAVETSIGFTPVEGILSSTGCGDIDPTIVFYLQSMGMSFEEITHLLSRQSGFSAIMDRQTSLADIINTGSDAQKGAALDIYQYHVKRYMGSFIAVLGGVDAVIFLADRPDLYSPVISQICRQLEFVGLKCNMPANKEDFLQDLTDNASLVKVFCLKCNKWEIMVHNIRRLLDKEK
ncbi:hypothetical protein MUP06_00780 [Patescibacteria group bacterium]|nr:hypothetical protein [Patescibacteria group bacterium]